MRYFNINNKEHYDKLVGKLQGRHIAIKSSTQKMMCILLANWGYWGCYWILILVTDKQAKTSYWKIIYSLMKY